MRPGEVEEIIGKQTDRELSGHERGTAGKRGATWGGGRGRKSSWRRATGVYYTTSKQKTAAELLN